MAVAPAGTHRAGTTAFRPRARLIHTIGDDLISSGSVAILELVKNAYDADASHVLIEFSAPLKPGHGSIAVIDNGYGMALDTVLEQWMQPATSAKQGRKRSPKGRRVLGEKGIGRFAASRLATELELITRQAEGSFEVCALLDWTEFDRKQFLDEVEFQWVERRPVEINAGGSIERLLHATPTDQRSDCIHHGTILKLSKLRESWDDNALRDLRTSLARLVAPSSEVKGFGISLVLPAEFRELSGLVTPPPSLGLPDYMIRGEIAEDGSYHLVYQHEQQSETIRERHSLSPGGRRAVCGPFELELRVWDREPSSVERLASRLGSTIRDVRGDLNRAAGVSIYRDGFRVLPYGERRNDWLRLDMRRVQNPSVRISNNQMVGAIFISADRNPELADQTNREGLQQGQALNDLEALTIEALSELERRRFAVRRRKQRETDSDSSNSENGGRNLFAGIDLEPLQSLVREKYAEDRRLRRAVDDQDRAISEKVAQVKEAFARYSRLATLGQLVDVVLHDGRTYLARLGHQITLAERDVATLDDSSLPIRRHLNKIKDFSHSLDHLFHRIEPFSGRTRGRLETVTIERVIADAIDTFKGDLERLKVTLSIPDTQTRVRVISRDVQQIFVNLAGNSLYWLDRVPEGTRRIEYSVRQLGSGEIEVVFCDSGPGIPSQFRDHVFEPYFSSKPDGTGLGLTIAGETAAEYDGRLELLAPGPSPCFRVTLRGKGS